MYIIIITTCTYLHVQYMLITCTCTFLLHANCSQSLSLMVNSTCIFSLFSSSSAYSSSSSSSFSSSSSSSSSIHSRMQRQVKTQVAHLITPHQLTEMNRKHLTHPHLPPPPLTPILTHPPPPPMPPHPPPLLPHHSHSVTPSPRVPSLTPAQPPSISLPSDHKATL